MARGKPSPDEQIAALVADQERIEGERNAATAALRGAREQLGDEGPRSLRNRQREMLLAEARGRPGELPQVLERDTAAAHASVQANMLKIEALDQAMAEIGREIEQVQDSHLEFYARKAHQASIEAVEAQQEAREAIERAWSTWRAADGGWSQVRGSRRHLLMADLPLGPLSNLQSLVNAFNRTCVLPPWPAGQRPRSDTDLAHAWAPADYPARFEKAAPVPA
jgi:uncharacterized protein YukE